MLRSEDVALWCREKSQTLAVGQVAQERFTRNAVDVYDKLTLNGHIRDFILFEQHKNGLCKFARVS